MPLDAPEMTSFDIIDLYDGWREFWSSMHLEWLNRFTMAGENSEVPCP